ncbi:MAG: hypothetical protein A2289_11540 [Deltaproteobacteria bacterium RIFOXYA12_FULL_58_15]|nr:MAG: hypothetical protein A2289_11540 [Deltaproteobacteria bacterium RIFOXYA12_FULL_58_15]OGR08337.1 MAG: hypothetical protein A2341_25035 [Deltaproteobacteria bacterium RIFOXYB12_FULL_58_9]
MMWRPIEQGPLVIGRNPECDLCIPDDRLSPVQCVLRRNGDAVEIQNHHPDGTQVGNETVLESMPLANGDSLALGPVTAKVCFVADQGDGGGTKTLAPSAAVVEGEMFLTAPETHPGKRWSLRSREIKVGSDLTNDLTLDDEFVSSFHARFSIEDGRCIVRDLGSRNGVFVAGQKIKEGEVPVGAQVTLGQTVLVVTGRNQPLSVPDAGSSQKLIGSSVALDRVRKVIRRIAAAEAPVLITGETGTGKEVVARLLAELSPRATRPFVALNCGSLSRNLIESELFGHERGAFTGAINRKIGAFEAAHAGTLFLDEIGELPLELQPQLLRVLETGEIRRVGSTSAFECDVRVIAATNRKLEQEVANGAFREDLFHRLHVLMVELPALAERKGDVRELATFFAEQFAPDGQTVSIGAGALAVLEAHMWPGNVRELRNVIQRAVLLRNGDTLEAADITFTPSTLATRVQTQSVVSGRTLQEIERDAIVAELRRHQGNKKEAAAALGVSRSTIHRKIEDYRIDIEG